MSDNVLYEGSVGTYSFQMINENTIEVWADWDNEFPVACIHVKEIKSKKDFDMEIGYWMIQNS